MKYLLLICSGLLFIALAKLPIGYYTFLRIIITISSIIVIIKEIGNGIGFWVIIFVIFMIIFNPLIPVYLNNKSAWIPIDFIAGVLFLIKSFTLKNHKKLINYKL